MKQLLLAILLFIPTIVSAQTITWTNPTTREDGTALAPTEIAGYRLYWGEFSGDYQMSIVIEGYRTAHAVEFPAGKDTYYTITVIDTDGRESTYANEAVASIPMSVPKPATNLQFILSD